jgi:hypothetical protein
MNDIVTGKDGTPSIVPDHLPDHELGDHLRTLGKGKLPPDLDSRVTNALVDEITAHPEEVIPAAAPAAAPEESSSDRSTFARDMIERAVRDGVAPISPDEIPLAEEVPHGDERPAPESSDAPNADTLLNLSGPPFGGEDDFSTETEEPMSATALPGSGPTSPSPRKWSRGAKIAVGILMALVVVCGLIFYYAFSTMNASVTGSGKNGEVTAGDQFRAFGQHLAEVTQGAINDVKRQVADLRTYADGKFTEIAAWQTKTDTRLKSDEDSIAALKSQVDKNKIDTSNLMTRQEFVQGLQTAVDEFGKFFPKDAAPAKAPDRVITPGVGAPPAAPAAPAAGPGAAPPAASLPPVSAAPAAGKSEDKAGNAGGRPVVTSDVKTDLDARLKALRSRCPSKAKILTTDWATSAGLEALSDQEFKNLQCSGIAMLDKPAGVTPLATAKVAIDKNGILHSSIEQCRKDNAALPTLAASCMIAAPEVVAAMQRKKELDAATRNKELAVVPAQTAATKMTSADNSKLLALLDEKLAEQN